MMSVNHIPLRQSLGKLLQGLVAEGDYNNIIISDITLDSRAVCQYSLFIAVPGLTVDGRKFIDAAIAANAAAVIWDCESGAVPIPVVWRSTASGNKVPVIAVTELRKHLGTIAKRFFHAPSEHMHVIGITGTNGKTSCSHFIAQAIGADEKSGVIGTLGWGQPGHLHESSHTTPDVLSCHKWLFQMYNDGVRTVAMEVSSHALDQGRVDEVAFEQVVFTNLSHEHLDYHGDLDSYAEAKSKLFLREGIHSAVINVDDDCGAMIAGRMDKGIKLLRYGINKDREHLDIQASDIVQTGTGLQFNLLTFCGNASVSCPVYGLFNVYNILATVGVLILHGYSLHQVKDKISRLNAINGRFAVLQPRAGLTVIIDYAHTPDALQQSLSTARQHFHDRTLWCVFGCGGDRDMSKRPKMGKVAYELSDHVVITSDNPRSESAVKIMQDIQAGMPDQNKVMQIEERREAIYYALSHAQENDVVLIAGKGHESYQLIGSTRYPFNDAQVVADYFAGKSHG